jgi:hypothetical protein
VTLLDVHPEHLVDNILTGEMSDVEQAQLRAHVAQCDACRLELGVAQVLKENFKNAGRSRPRAPQATQELAVEGALSAMLAQQMLRVPALRTLPVTHFRLKRNRGQRIVVAALLFCLGAIAAVFVMRQMGVVPIVVTTEPLAAPSSPSPKPPVAKSPEN